MNEARFEELVRAVSRELRDGAAADDGQGGFYLVDNWRVRPGEREAFLSYYTSHVADVIRSLDGCRTGRVLVSPIESSYSWHIQAFYEFESERILDRFMEDFDRELRRRFRGETKESVLDALDQWVLAHEDGTLLEINR
jgi:hypothetical protein